ncbi:hypothetical protein CHU98_g433 [Xylaria longipes]|nr:hypothetical protein CHU98_g433 [Xylaria longipes]
MLAVYGFCYDVVDKVTHDIKGLLVLALNMKRNRATHINSLWRLLILDRIFDVTPAPKVVGLYFPAMVGALMAVTNPISRPEQEEVTNEELNDWLHITTELCELEPDSRPFLPNVELVQEVYQQGNSCNMDHDVLQAMYIAREAESVQLRAVEAGLVPELEQLLGSDLADTSEKGFAYQAMVMFRDNLAQGLVNLLVSKCFFATVKAERLGIGDESVKTGDEVWILHSASTPILLRPLENGNYEYLGETYVHGIMGDGITDEFRIQDVQRVYIE